MTEFIKIFKIIGLITLVIGVLAIVGDAINGLDWLWSTLTNIFIIIRKFNLAMDWAIPVNDALWPAVAATLSLNIAEWALLGALIPIKFLRKE